uniref:Uncharacterized protein n=1 Tax=Sander lucioperca TaxID=283035 RepID=A0A8C9ZXG2_SANLU
AQEATEVGSQVQVGEGQCGHSQQARQEPNSTQRRQHGAPRAQPAAGQRVHDGQVAVKAQAGKAENTGVHVDQNNVAADLAQSHTKGPVVAQSCVHGPQRQGYNKGEVSNGQVSYVDICSPTFRFGSPDSKDDHAVT